MTEKRVNPELIVAAASKVYPKIKDWEYDGEENGCVSVDLEKPRTMLTFRFNSLTNPADAHALMLALMDEKNGGWEFGKTRDQFHARRKEGQVTTFMCDTPVGILLMRCVAFESSIPLYLTNPGGDV